MDPGFGLLVAFSGIYEHPPLADPPYKTRDLEEPGRNQRDHRRLLGNKSLDGDRLNSLLLAYSLLFPAGSIFR
jgi:hypothetical protein